jgi:hypothetical protein
MIYITNVLPYIIILYGRNYIYKLKVIKPNYKYKDSDARLFLREKKSIFLESKV